MQFQNLIITHWNSKAISEGLSGKENVPGSVQIYHFYVVNLTFPIILNFQARIHMKHLYGTRYICN